MESDCKEASLEKKEDTLSNQDNIMIMLSTTSSCMLTNYQGLQDQLHRNDLKLNMELQQTTCFFRGSSITKHVI